jgi:hypothetical protein
VIRYKQLQNTTTKKGDNKMQTLTSANTSINKNRVPSIYNMHDAHEAMKNKLVIDIGGGKYNNAISHAKERFNADVSIYDKFNRSDEHNAEVLDRSYDVAVISNVLNVIDSSTERRNVIALALFKAKTVLITVYEGNKSGIGKQTGVDQWQENRATKDYVKEIKDNFPLLNVSIKGKLITIK